MVTKHAPSDNVGSLSIADGLLPSTVVSDIVY
jgi:hypothetical protein